MKDRRVHRRENRTYPVEYYTLKCRDPAAPVHAQTVDVSDAGLSIRTPSAIEPGEELSLELRQDPEQRPVLAVGRVIASRPDSDGWITGIELTWVDGGAVNPNSAMRPQSMWSFL